MWPISKWAHFHSPNQNRYRIAADIKNHHRQSLTRLHTERERKKERKRERERERERNNNFKIPKMYPIKSNRTIEVSIKEHEILFNLRKN